MRFEKAEDLLQLAFALQSSAEGISLNDIEERFGVTRRTAQRMRDAIIRVFPQIEEVQSDSRIKRWRMRSKVANRMINFSADELASLDVAMTRLSADNLNLQANALMQLREKLRSLVQPDALARMEPDLEALIEAEGMAMRPGPKPTINGEHLGLLREAIKACKVVVLHYRGNGDGKISLKKIAPYGFLYGHRHYLIGAATETGRDKTYMFRLSAIEKIDITNENFERDPKFSLRDYAERSFGLWQGDVVDVVLRFTPYAADNARDFIFHPTQVQEEQPDGSLIVRFRAGSLMEMAWHLYSWGTDVEVLAPAGLAEMVNGSRRHWDGLP